MSETTKCELCGEPMPPGEEMFRYHGYSGPCPAPPPPNRQPVRQTALMVIREPYSGPEFIGLDEEAGECHATFAMYELRDGEEIVSSTALAAARAEVETLTRDRDGWERRTKELGSVVIRAWALLRDWWQYAQLEEREEPFVDALTRALAADAAHDAYALAEIRRWRDVAGEAARLRGVLEEVREQLKYTGVSSALLPMVESALAAQEGTDAT